MKKRTLTLALRKTKIVNFSATTQIQGGSIETDTFDPEASCGQYCTITDTDFTDDKANTFNSIPTLTLIGITVGCSPV